MKPSPRRLERLPAWSGTLALVLTVTSPAASHLCIVRQGNESAGVRENGDEFGSSVAVGDFNGDGYDDLATGARAEDVGAALGAGAVVISWGSERGVTEVGAQLITRAEAGGGSPVTGDEFAYALAAGDFNDDGFTDLAIGAPGVNGGAANDSGIVFVMRGTASGLVVWHSLDQSLFGGANETGDRFGEVLDAGYLDGDGNLDLVIGGPGEDSSAGAIFWRMGSGGGLFGASGWAKQSSYGGTNTPGDLFGASLSIGNVTWDGYAEIVVGSPGKDVSGVENAGMVWVIAGSASGPTAFGTFVITADDLGSLSSAGTFGFAVEIGWFMNAGGYYSVAISEPGYDFTGVNESGRVFVIPGNDVTLAFEDVRVLDKFDVGGSTILPFDWFGYRLESGFFGAPDGYEDLAIGVPYDDIDGQAINGGYVYVSHGGPDGPGTNGWNKFMQGNLNDYLDSNALLGWSLAFGELDGTGNGHLVVGAPGDAQGTGMAHIIAPWRQTFGLNSRNAVSYDCDHNLIFSQKPFDEVLIASTTKVMTVLLACERTQLPPSDPDHVAPSTVYDVPGWCSLNVPGSQVPLVLGEEMSLENLMYTCLMLSGNDAAYAIAHLLGGNSPTDPAGSVAGFVTDMNLRAISLGMSGTSFHNPAGLDGEFTFGLGGSHHSTAEDMATLSRAAMENPLFRQISETTERTITRHMESTGGPISYDWTFNNFMNWIVDNGSFPEGIGIKGGYTPGAEITGVYAADAGFGQFAVAGTFFSPQEIPSDIRRQDGIELLELGLAECDVFPAGIITDLFEFYLGDVSSAIDDVRGITMPYGANEIESVSVDFYRSDGVAAATTARIEFGHICSIHLDPNGEETFGISPFEGHDDIVVTNIQESPIFLRFSDTVNPTGVTAALDPGESHIVPAFYGGPDALYSLLIENMLPDFPVSFSVEARYVFDATLPSGSDGEPSFRFEMPRQARYAEEVYDLRVVGTDPVPGRSLAVHVHDAEIVLGTDESEDVESLSIAPVHVRQAGPSPFRSSAAFTLDVSRAGRVAVEIFTPTGARVAHLSRDVRAPGSIRLAWDGRSEEGHGAASGMYLYRVSLDGLPAATGSLVRLR